MWKKLYECECGSTIQDRTCAINLHNKSQKHQDFLKVGFPVKIRRGNKIKVDTEKLNYVQLMENIILEYDI